MSATSISTSHPQRATLNSHHTHSPIESCNVPPVDQCNDGITNEHRKSSLIGDFIYKHSFQHMIAGSTAGIFSKTIMQPVDLIKTRLQVQDGRGKHEYKSIFDAFRSIIKYEGIRGLYRGLTPNLIGSGVSWGIYFFTYNQFKLLYRTVFNYTESNRLPPYAHLLCAGSTGCITSLATNPIWLIKVRLQLQGKEVRNTTRQYTGVVDAFIRIVREEGFVSLYRGIGPALLLVSNGALQFMFYEQFKRVMITNILHNDETRLNAAHFLSMGGLAKGMSATITYPLMNVRSRLYQKKPDTDILKINTSSSSSSSHINSIQQSSNNIILQSGEAMKKMKHVEHKYANMSDVIIKVYTYEGLRGFYRGLSAQLIKTVPASAVTFFGYETVLRFINKTMPHVQTNPTH